MIAESDGERQAINSSEFCLAGCYHCVPYGCTLVHVVAHTYTYTKRTSTRHAHGLYGYSLCIILCRLAARLTREQSVYHTLPSGRRRFGVFLELRT